MNQAKGEHEIGEACTMHEEEPGERASHLSETSLKTTSSFSCAILLISRMFSRCATSFSISCDVKLSTLAFRPALAFRSAFKSPCRESTLV
jgi:hypothetical protein